MTLPLLVMLLGAPARAGYPEDVTLSKMTTYRGERVVGGLDDDYLQLIRQLGTAVSNKPLAPGETLGANGFDLSMANTFVFIDTENSDGSPSAWVRSNPDEDPPGYLFMPQLSARKGLPFSLEAGVNAAWMGLTRQGTFGGFGRLGVIEGHKPLPDITVQVGYVGYVGNDELELGVMDFGVTVGSTFAFGSFPGINNAQFSPYLNYTTLRILAQPLLDEDTAADIGAVPISGRKKSDTYSREMVIPEFGGGFQVTNGTVLMRLSGTWAPSSVATATIGMGFQY